MDFKTIFVLLALCFFKSNDGLCRDRCIPYPVPFEVGCPAPSSCGCPPTVCSPTSTCNSWFRDVHEPCNPVDVVYFPEVQYPCGLEWDRPFYYGTCWCS